MSSILLLTVLIIENINGRFYLNDFKVYYHAGDALRTGGPLYGEIFTLESGFYKYSPFIGLFFIPFSILPYTIAGIIHFTLIATSTILAILLFSRWLRSKGLDKGQSSVWPLVLAFMAVAIHYIRELHLGNINVIVLLLLLVILLKCDNRPLLSGILLALILCCKPYFLILGLPLLLWKKWALIKWTALSLVGMFFTTVLIWGWSKSIELHQGWVWAMGHHDNHLSSFHTLSGLFCTYTGIEESSLSLLVSAIVPVVIIGALYMPVYKKSEVGFVWMSLSMVAIVPNMVTTDTQHFLWTSPLILWSIFLARRMRVKSLILSLVILLALYGLNSSDLLGRELSLKVEAWGILGMANIGLVLLFHRMLLLWQSSKTSLR